MSFPRHEHPLLVIAAPALLAIALYAVTLWGTFVYDDHTIVLNDPRVTQPGMWPRLLRERYLPVAADSLWRPVASLSYVLQYRLHRDLAWPYHAVNILLHAAVSAAVAELARRWTADPRAALIAGLLFAAHPVHVEAVAPVVGRAETLCALGAVGALVLAARRPMTIARALAITACFVVSLLSKEHGVLVPALLAAWFIIMRFVAREAIPADEGEKRALAVGAALLCLATLAYVSYRERFTMQLLWDHYHLRWTVNPIVRAEGIDRALIPLSVLGRYAALLAFPARLSPDYGAAVTDYRFRWDDPYGYLGAAAIALWGAAVVISIRRRWTLTCLCLICAAICYSLISNFLYLIGTIMGERLIYLMSVFPLILLAAALARLRKGALVVLLAIVLGLMSLRTVTYAWRWNDALRLFSLCRMENPRSVYLRVLEAEELLLRGDAEAAERVLAPGRQMVPESQNVWAMSARAAKMRGRDEEAQQFGARAADLEFNPPHVRRARPRTP